MKDQQIDRLIVHARSHTNRARRCLRDGDQDQARKHTKRATHALALVSQARAVAAVSQFIN